MSARAGRPRACRTYGLVSRIRRWVAMLGARILCRCGVVWSFLMISPECIWPLGAELGEGPVWSKSDKAVYFVDIKRKHVHRYATRTRETMTWPAPSEPCF